MSYLLPIPNCLYDPNDSKGYSGLSFVQTNSKQYQLKLDLSEQETTTLSSFKMNIDEAGRAHSLYLLAICQTKSEQNSKIVHTLRPYDGLFIHKWSKNKTIIKDPSSRQTISKIIWLAIELMQNMQYDQVSSNSYNICYLHEDVFNVEDQNPIVRPYSSKQSLIVYLYKIDKLKKRTLNDPYTLLYKRRLNELTNIGSDLFKISQDSSLNNSGFFDQNGTSLPLRLSTRVLEMAGSLGNSEALASFSDDQERLKVLKNKSLAYLCYYEKAENGDPEAMNNLGLCLQEGIGTQKNEAEGFNWYRKAAEAGYFNTMNNLGYCLEKGIGTQKNHNEAVSCYIKGANAGFVSAMYSLGVCLQKGIGTQKNEAESVAWYRKAADGGLVDAMNNLGFCLQHGIGTQKNESEAFRWFKKAALTGQLDAMNNLGFCLQERIGTKKNKSEAFRWFKKAAEAGHLGGMMNLGFNLMHGIGTQKNESEGFNWIRRAADAGLPLAMANLSFCLNNGIGVKKNEAEGEYWGKKASEALHLSATNQLS